MERQAETTIAVLAALFVLFSAMIDPLISIVAAVAGCGAIVAYTFARRRAEA